MFLNVTAVKIRNMELLVENREGAGDYSAR